VIDPAFDGHPIRDFATMTPEERLDDLSRKIALVHELRRSRAPLEAGAAETQIQKSPAFLPGFLFSRAG